MFCVVCLSLEQAVTQDVCVFARASTLVGKQTNYSFEETLDKAIHARIYF